MKESIGLWESEGWTERCLSVRSLADGYVSMRCTVRISTGRSAPRLVQRCIHSNAADAGLALMRSHNSSGRPGTILAGAARTPSLPFA